MSTLDIAEPALPSPPESPSKNKNYQPFGLVHLAEFNANNQAQHVQQLPDGLPNPDHYAAVHEHNNFIFPGGPTVRVGQPAFHDSEPPGYGGAHVRSQVQTI